MEDTKPMSWVKADTDRLEHAVRAEKAPPAEERDEEQGGVIIIPPLLTDTERNAYPEDYINYCREREKKRQKLQEAGIPTPEVPDFPAELMEQAEEASKVFQAQAEEFTRAMEEKLRGSAL